MHGFTPSADPTTVAHVIDWQPPNSSPSSRPSPGRGSRQRRGRAGTARAGHRPGHPNADPGDARYPSTFPTRHPETTSTSPPGLSARSATSSRNWCSAIRVIPRRCGSSPRRPRSPFRGVPAPELSMGAGRRHRCRAAPGGWISARTTTSPTARRRCPRWLPTPTKSVMLLRDGACWSVCPPGAPSGPPCCRPDGPTSSPAASAIWGLLMAGWLVQRGARRLVLGRTGLSSEPPPPIRPPAAVRPSALERRGCPSRRSPSTRFGEAMTAFRRARE